MKKTTSLYLFTCISSLFLLFISQKINAGAVPVVFKNLNRLTIEEPIVAYDQGYAMFTASWSWADGDFPPPYRIEIYTESEFPYYSSHNTYDKHITRYLMLPQGEYIHVKLTSEIYYISTSTTFYNP